MVYGHHHPHSVGHRAQPLEGIRDQSALGQLELDLIGSSAGFRRPGYSIGIEPGLSYSYKKTAFSVSVPWLVRRVRPQSYADKLATAATGKFVNGDAAFADYIVIAGFSRRF